MFQVLIYNLFELCTNIIHKFIQHSDAVFHQVTVAARFHPLAFITDCLLPFLYASILNLHIIIFVTNLAIDMFFCTLKGLC